MTCGDTCGARTCENAACSAAENSELELTPELTPVLVAGAVKFVKPALGAGLPICGAEAGRSRREAPPIVLLLTTDPFSTEPLKLDAADCVRDKREGANGGAS